jgi:hypothetical protein
VKQIADRIKGVIVKAGREDILNKSRCDIFISEYLLLLSTVFRTPFKN